MSSNRITLNVCTNPEIWGDDSGAGYENIIENFAAAAVAAIARACPGFEVGYKFTESAHAQEFVVESDLDNAWEIEREAWAAYHGIDASAEELWTTPPHEFRATIAKAERGKP